MTHTPTDSDGPRDRPSQRPSDRDAHPRGSGDDPLLAAFSERVAELEELVSRLEPADRRTHGQQEGGRARPRTDRVRQAPSAMEPEEDEEELMEDLARLEERLEAETDSETTLEDLSSAIRRLRLELRTEPAEVDEPGADSSSSGEDDFVYPSGDQSGPEDEEPATDSPSERNAVPPTETEEGEEELLAELTRLKERLEAETDRETTLEDLSSAIRRLRFELRTEPAEVDEPGADSSSSGEDDFVYPSGDRSEPEDEEPTTDSPNERNRRELERLGSLVEELRNAVGDSVRAGRTDAGATVASARRELEARERSRGRSDAGEAASGAATDTSVSLPDVVRVLTEVIEVVRSIADEMDDTQRVNGALWEILNDIQVEVVELERELSDYDRTVEIDGDDLSIEEAIQRAYAHNEPFHRLADELASLQDSLEVDLDDDRIEELRSELDEIDDLREEIDDLREEIARVRDDLEAVKQWQESEFLENAEIEIRGDEELRQEFEALEQENRAIKELLAGLQSRVD